MRSTSKVSLHEFLPYGAPDLIAAARPDLARSLAVSAGGWAIVFVAMVIALPWMPAPRLVGVAPPRDPVVPIPVVTPVTPVVDPGTPVVAPRAPGVAGGVPVPAPEPMESGAGETPLYEVDELPQPVTSPVPEYPSLAREIGLEGVVAIKVLVGRDGRVEAAEVVHSGGTFDGAALESARRWVFTPALVRGHPVRVWVVLPFRFKLR